MAEEPANDPVLTRFRPAVTEIYGERAERVVLFGLLARGDARSDSDYDIAVFLREASTFSDESARLANVNVDIHYDMGAPLRSQQLR